MKNDGGPAFPRAERIESGRESVPSYHVRSVGGMSLRDYFAGQALTGVFTSGDTDITDSIMAKRCYEIADAMLAEREKP